MYLGMYGWRAWYSYDYSDSELEEIVEKILDARPGKAFRFFNNNHDMLGNARKMFNVLK